MNNTISLAELDKYFVKISEKQFDKRFIDRCVIGKGAGSIICKAIDTKMQNKWIALKMYNKVQMREQNRIDVARQIQILFSLQGKEGSECIVKVFEAYRIEKNFGSEYCLALELCQQSLYDYIRRQEYHQVPDIEKVKICLKVSQGLRFLHQNSIIHRDFKPGNVLVKENNGELVYLIADFGQSKVFQFGVQNSILRGTVIYSNPHALQETNYSVEPDVFSLALTMIQILADGKSLFDTESIRNEYKLRQQMKKKLADVDVALNNVPGLRKETKGILTRCLSQVKVKVQEVCQSLSDIIAVMEIDQKCKAFEEVTEFPKAFSKKQHGQVYTQEKQKISAQHQENIMKVYHIDSENKSNKQAEFLKGSGKTEQDRIDKSEKRKDERLSTKESDENISKIDSIYKEDVNRKKEEDRKMKKVQSWFNVSEKNEVEVSLQISKSDINGHSESNPPVLPKSVKVLPIQIQFEQNATQISSDPSWFPHQVDVSWIHRKSNIKPVVNTNKMVFAKKVLCVQEGIKKRCDQISQSIVLMQNLTKYKQKLLKLKAIQNSNLEPNEKSKLMLICLKQLINQVNTELKQLANPESKKKYEKYMENLKVHYKKIHENFIAYYSRSQLTEVIEFLKKENNNEQQTMKHYKSLIRRDSNLSRVLDGTSKIN